MSPLKRAFEKYKPRVLFSEFYGILLLRLHFCNRQSGEEAQ